MPRSVTPESMACLFMKCGSWVSCFNITCNIINTKSAFDKAHLVNLDEILKHLTPSPVDFYVPFPR